MNSRIGNHGLLAALAAAVMLAACGGGGGDSAPVPPTPPTNQATVTSATVTNALFGQTALLTIAGSNLDAGLTVTSAGCNNVSRSTTAPNVSTATTAYYTCTVAAFGAQTFSIVRTADGSVLSSPAYSVSGPQVTSATVTNAKYSQNALVTVNGSNLDTGLSVTSPTCTGMARSTTAPNVSTATTAYYTCKVGTVADNQSVSIVRTGDSATLSTPSFNVPLPQVTMTVSNGAAVSGSMVITLEAVKTPITVNNFLAYTNAGFYDGTVFHRREAAFVIQGGGYLPVTGTPTLKTGLLAPIELEVNKGLSNVQWTIAMARGSAQNSATSQFFINLVNNTQLDAGAILPGFPPQVGYATFGSVTSNTALVTAIETAPCAAVTGFFNCVPTPAMVISSAVQTR